MCGEVAGANRARQRAKRPEILARFILSHLCRAYPSDAWVSGRLNVSKTETLKCNRDAARQA
jgi:hypothetical protein